MKIIENLRELNINFEYNGKEKINDFINNKKVVVTGSLVKYSRKEIEDLIESNGGMTSSSVSKLTDFVIILVYTSKSRSQVYIVARGELPTYMSIDNKTWS